MENKYCVDGISFEIGKLAVQAMLYEVSCFPSPGAVSPVSKGSHDDMNYYTFLDSTCALIPFMIRFSQAGLSKRTPKRIFEEIREIGSEAEKEMFKATNGINTHKGIIFLMGICAAAASKVIYDGLSFYDIKEIIKKMTLGIVKNELENKKDKINKTNGEKLFFKYGVKGIRGEVEKGIPIVFDFALDFYKNCSNLKKNDKLVHTLLGIMQYSEDTNIIHRQNCDILKQVQDKSKEIINLGGMYTEEGITAINKLEKEFIEMKISPGGSSDLLAVTVFMYHFEKYLSEA